MESWSNPANRTSRVCCGSVLLKFNRIPELRARFRCGAMGSLRNEDTKGDWISIVFFRVQRWPRTGKGSPKMLILNFYQGQVGWMLRLPTDKLWRYVSLSCKHFDTPRFTSSMGSNERACNRFITHPTAPRHMSYHNCWDNSHVVFCFKTYRSLVAQRVGLSVLKVVNEIDHLSISLSTAWFNHSFRGVEGVDFM